MSESPLQVSRKGNDGLLEIRLARPKANIVDAEMIAALSSAVEDAAADQKTKAILLAAKGKHFSFGASVEEHLPEQCAAMLGSLHRLVLQLVDCPLMILVAVRGQCLGGGLEVAMTGHLLFTAPDARLGQPEIKLGVIAPAASCLLPLRIGQMHAEDILLSGRSISAEEALRFGLAIEIAEDPEAAAIAYYDSHLKSLSGSSLRMAVRAARIGFIPQVRERIAEVESLYLKELMNTEDAVEGLTAFLANRPPIWKGC